MGVFIDITGYKYGRLTVVKYSHTDKSKAYKTYWLCSCECGGKRVVSKNDLIANRTRSCGCLQRERTLAKNVKHNATKTPEYQIWNGMRQRCLNPKSKAYKYYGALGVTICDRWLNSFDTFLADMGERPSPELSIDRINTFGNYEPSNCRWATMKEQANNKRKSKKYQNDN